MSKRLGNLVNLVILGGATAFFSLPVGATEAWVEVSITSTGDRVLVDQNSIQRTEEKVHYWEYRDLRQSRHASRQAVEQPVYGMMIYRAVNCRNQVGRVERLVIFNQDREVIRRVNYGESDAVDLPMQGSQSEAVLKFVCGSQ